MTTVEDALVGVSRLAIDTAPVIYFIEAHPRYDAVVSRVFQLIANRSITGITSVITLGEVLVQPYLRADSRLQEAYREFLLRSACFQTLPIDADVADSAANLRAQYHLRMPDALQLAVALHSGCEAFLTNDEDLRRVKDLRVVILEDLEIGS